MSVEEAWDELHDATPLGWYVGAPSFDERRDEWSLLYAFDTTESVEMGKRSREWIAVHPTQEGVLREMARCLHEPGEGRTPTSAGVEVLVVHVSPSVL